MQSISQLLRRPQGFPSRGLWEIEVPQLLRPSEYSILPVSLLLFRSHYADMVTSQDLMKTTNKTAPYRHHVYLRFELP